MIHEYLCIILLLVDI